MREAGEHHGLLIGDGKWHSFGSESLQVPGTNSMHTLSYWLMSTGSVLRLVFRLGGGSAFETS